MSTHRVCGEQPRPTRRSAGGSITRSRGPAVRAVQVHIRAPSRASPWPSPASSPAPPPTSFATTPGRTEGTPLAMRLGIASGRTTLLSACVQPGFYHPEQAGPPTGRGCGNVRPRRRCISMRQRSAGARRGRTSLGVTHKQLTSHRTAVAVRQVNMRYHPTAFQRRLSLATAFLPPSNVPARNLGGPPCHHPLSRHLKVLVRQPPRSQAVIRTASAVRTTLCCPARLAHMGVPGGVAARGSPDPRAAPPSRGARGQADASLQPVLP